MVPFVVAVVTVLLQLPTLGVSAQASAAPQVPPPPQPTLDQDIDTQVMQSAFRIEGPSVANPAEKWTGTGFFVAVPASGDPGYVDCVAVTAAHVLRGIGGDVASLIVRLRDDQQGYKRHQVQARIRKDSVPLWTEHPSADVAVIRCPVLPAAHAMRFVGVESLATDRTFEDYALHPGESVNAIGYPFGYELNGFGFPVVRQAMLASFPLVPARSLKVFIADFPAFGGNSGGPVYLYAAFRRTQGRMEVRQLFYVLGLVSENVTSHDGKQNVGLTKVVYAEFIRQAIDLLPPAPPLP